MPTRFVHLAVDSAQPPVIARFWTQMLGWSVSYEDDEESFVSGSAPDLGLAFVPVPEPKTVRNRIHLDLASSSPEHQTELVTRALDLGARRIDIGQGDVPWTVLADPENNEFCILEPRDHFSSSGPIAAMVLDTLDPPALAPFLSAAVGWPVHTWSPSYLALRAPTPDPGRPWLALVRTPHPKQAKNRIHIDVAPFPTDDHAAEVTRLTSLGARPVDVGQADAPWTVLADPQDNEFCVLTPR